jgi:AcrR family transcriptional regulator
VPPLTPTPPERSDAARNRRALLAAARRLFAVQDAAEVSMSDIAKEAGVGKGTLYRHFPDKATLCHAILDGQAREVQEEVIAGLPSAGVGATPLERLERLLDLLGDMVEEAGSLLLEAHRDSRLLSRPAYSWQRVSARVLLQQAADAGELAEGADVEFLASALIAPLLPDVWMHARRVQGLSVERLKAGVRQLIPRAG